MGVAKNATKSGEMNKVSYSISSEMQASFFRRFLRNQQFGILLNCA